VTPPSARKAEPFLHDQGRNAGLVGAAILRPADLAEAEAGIEAPSPLVFRLDLEPHALGRGEAGLELGKEITADALPHQIRFDIELMQIDDVPVVLVHRRIGHAADHPAVVGNDEFRIGSREPALERVQRMPRPRDLGNLAGAVDHVIGRMPAAAEECLHLGQIRLGR